MVTLMHISLMLPKYLFVLDMLMSVVTLICLCMLSLDMLVSVV